jgi:hypothetical protein
MKKFDEILELAYQEYVETHEHEVFIFDDEMGLNKQQFIEKCTNYSAFSSMYGFVLKSEEMTDETICQWKFRNPELTEIPNTRFTLIYKGQTFISYN